MLLLQLVLWVCLIACAGAWLGARQPSLRTTAGIRMIERLHAGRESWEAFFDDDAGTDDETYSLATRPGFDPSVEGIYGELLPSSLTALLSEPLVTLSEADVFYDLGCGTGKVVAQMAMETAVGRAVGIELGDRRFERAAKSLRLMKDATALPMATTAAASERMEGSDVARCVSKIHFLKGDLLAHTWSDATVLFINAFCFPPPLMRLIERRVKHDCPKLRFVFLFGQRFRHDMTLATGRHYENYLSPETPDEQGKGEGDGEEEQEQEWARHDWPFNLYAIPAPMSFADETECQMYVSHGEFR